MIGDAFSIYFNDLNVMCILMIGEYTVCCKRISIWRCFSQILWSRKIPHPPKKPYRIVSYGKRNVFKASGDTSLLG